MSGRTRTTTGGVGGLVQEKRYARSLRRFGLRPEQYDKMVARQGGLCPICLHPPKHRRLAVDHDHTSKRKPSRLHGRIRGAACATCNRFRIGLNTAQTARRVLAYLESSFDGRLL